MSPEVCNVEPQQHHCTEIEVPTNPESQRYQKLNRNAAEERELVNPEKPCYQELF